MRIAMTGASFGVGAELASRLTAAGHEVTAFDVEKPQANVTRWVAMDLAHEASIAAATSQISGPFEALVAISLLPPTKGQAEKVLQVNFLGIRLFMDEMMIHLAPGASVVSLGSRTGAQWRDHLDEVRALLTLSSPQELAALIEKYAIDDLRAFHLSKEAVIATTVAETEKMLRRGVRINSVSPAAVVTEDFDDFMRAFGEKAAANIARTGRPGTPEEIVDVIEWLISPKSSWVKGQNVIVDGGTESMNAADALELHKPPEEPPGFWKIVSNKSVITRSVRIALVVGTILGILNHGDKIFAGEFGLADLTKVALTYVVPFCVSTFSAYLAVRGRKQHIEIPF